MLNFRHKAMSWHRSWYNKFASKKVGCFDRNEQGVLAFTNLTEADRGLGRIKLNEVCMGVNSCVCFWHGKYLLQPIVQLDQIGFFKTPAGVHAPDPDACCELT